MRLAEEMGEAAEGETANQAPVVTVS